MFKNKINLSIPKPCNENWLEMTPMEKARFCGVCQKNIFDFTKATDREIIVAYNRDKNLCGRFYPNQLNRELIIPKEKSSVWMATVSAIITFLGMGNHEVAAQEKIGKVKIEQTEGKVLQDTIKKIKNKKLEITGIISDNSGPLPGANIRIIGTNTVVHTDLNGNFSIQIKRNATLEISFIGMKTIKVKVKKTNKLLIKLEDAPVILGFVTEE